MEETRHVASWRGGQEALHDRVLTLDQALAELNAVTSEGILSLARRLINDDGLRLAVVAPPRRGRRLESLLRLPGGAA
jgi:predicted Zn-dependent peptidase